MLFVIFFFIPRRTRRRIPPERLANPNDPYYTCCCCTNIMKSAPIVSIIGFALDIILAILGLVFTLFIIDKDFLSIALLTAYPLISSIVFLGLFVANLKKMYDIFCSWYLPGLIFYMLDMCAGLFLIIAAFAWNSTNDDCDFNCDDSSSSISNLSTKAQTFMIIIGALYLVVSIIRLTSLALQMKIRNYWFYIIEKRWSPPVVVNATTYPPANPPAYAPNPQVVVNQPIYQQNQGDPWSVSANTLPLGQPPRYDQINEQHRGYHQQNLGIQNLNSNVKA
uniref:Uncharacterized protein n=1 Tax=Acrobeloides nanus TaxID=290746 RepID=A0A914EBU0_9BILA